MFSEINRVVYPVGRITQNGVSLLGTVFLTNKPGVFVTASHVCNNNDNNLVIVLSNTKSFYDYQDTTDNQVRFVNARIIETDPFSDLSILKIDMAVTSSISITGSDNCNPGDAVVIFGFPHADQGRMVLTEQRTQIGAKVLIDSSGIKTKHIILNIHARPGQSGGPIFSAKDLSLLGILIGSYAPSASGGISLGGIDPQTLHQTTHAVSAEYIKEMI